jgi:hypothetical protein
MTTVENIMNPEEKFELSPTYKCPCCGKPLCRKVNPLTHLVELWCGHGPCKSLAMNFGDLGLTEGDVYNILVVQYEKEQEKL